MKRSKKKVRLQEPDMRKVVLQRLRHMQRVKLANEMFKAQTENLEMRQWHQERQKRANFREEHDRIRAEIASNSIFPPGTLRRLQSRQEKLRRLAGSALGTDRS